MRRRSPTSLNPLVRLVPPGAGFGKINSGACILSGRLTELPVTTVVSTCHPPEVDPIRFPSTSVTATVPVTVPDATVAVPVITASVAKVTPAKFANSTFANREPVSLEPAKSID